MSICSYDQYASFLAPTLIVIWLIGIDQVVPQADRVLVRLEKLAEVSNNCVLISSSPFLSNFFCPELQLEEWLVIKEIYSDCKHVIEFVA